MAKFEILNGNELIIQGGLEAGFSLYTGYPGSPLADYFNILYKRKQEFHDKGIRVVIANSEANAAAMASGAKQAGRDTLVAMKSMGLHVASDALSVGNFANPGAEFTDPDTGESVVPGVVIAVGDDPWSISTSTPADSRYLFKHLHIPFLEPSTPKELKDWMKVALDISRRTSVYQGLLLTTFMAEGGGRVELGEERAVSHDLVHIDPASFDLSKNVMVPPNSLKADVTMINERFPRVKEIYRRMNLDTKTGAYDSGVGFISAGVIYETLKQVMEEKGLLESNSLYKVASSFPLVEDFLVPWLERLETVVVVEEKRGFLEGELRRLIGEQGLNVKVVGKEFNLGLASEGGFPAHGGLNYEIIAQKIERLFEIMGGESCPHHNPEISTLSETLPKRLPTFCPGCPHRETLSLLKDLRRTLDKEGVKLISHGDVGCYSLSFLPPFKEMHNLSAMGQGGALGAGFDLFTNNPSVVLMGDSTFYHSGLTDISNSVQSGHNITYILLDNDNTAMTGHQMTPASGINVEGVKRPVQSMLSVVRGLGVREALEVNPSDRYFYQNVLHGYIKKPGVKVIVSNKECALTFHARRKAQERKLFNENRPLEKQSFFQINPWVCEDCRVCVTETGCPGLSQTFDGYGPKVTIDPQICVSDSYCTKLKACPSFEEVIVDKYHPTLYKSESSERLTHNLEVSAPELKKTFDDIASGNDLRIVVTGVGGTGVTTISRVLAEAAKKMGGREDIDFKFVDQKGLAQRNGNVTGHLALYKKGKSYGAVTPLGTADLLLSPDLLDGPSHLDFLSQSGEIIVDQKFQVPLSVMLDRAIEGEPITVDRLKEALTKAVGERAHILGFKDICEVAFGKSVYASAMVLGAAFQSGRLPFSEEDLISAFRSSIKSSEVEANLEAFRLGRLCYQHGTENVLGSAQRVPTTASEQDIFKQSLKESFPFWRSGKKTLISFEINLERLIKKLPEIKVAYLAQYLHDIYLYDRGRYAEEFITSIDKILELYPTMMSARAIRTLARTYFIKDEVFIAHMMISPMIRLKDAKAYAQVGRKYSKIFINRPSFNIFDREFTFDISPRPWMLRIMRHFRILRFILSGWHFKENKIAKTIRKKLLELPNYFSGEELRVELVKLENIKGYREVRYEAAMPVIGDVSESPPTSGAVSSSAH